MDGLNYESVLFDLDGTLTDSAPGILNSIRYALERMGRPVPDAATLNAFIGPPLLDSFQRHCGLSSEESREALRLYRERFATKGLLENSVYPGVVGMLEALKARGLKIILATSKPEAFARRILDHFGLTRFFDAIHGATMDERRSRKAEVIAWALAHSGEIGRAVMVGDRANDIEGARANGIAAIGVLWGYGDEAELRRAGATIFVRQPSEILV